MKIKIKYFTSEGAVVECKDKIDEGLALQTEIDTGMSYIDNNYTPYEVVVTLKPYEKKKISVICTLEKEYPTDAFAVIDANRNRIQGLVKQAGYEDEFVHTKNKRTL